MIDIEGKVILVVGGTGKIGSHLCECLINEGARVVSLSRSPSNVCHPHLFHKQVDATSNLEFTSLLLDIVSDLGSVSSLINCSCYRPLANQNKFPSEIDISQWNSSILQNSLLLHVPTSIVAQYMDDNSIQGSIIAISSIYGVLAPNFNIYNDTLMTTEPDYAYNKSAAIGYTRYMASRYSGSKIRFNVIVPGGFLDGQDERFVANYSANAPLSRMADYKDICGLVEFLCSDSSSYITGSVIPLDGGWSLI